MKKALLTAVLAVGVMAGHLAAFAFTDPAGKTDFNDMAKAAGKEVVREYLATGNPDKAVYAAISKRRAGAGHEMALGM